MKLLGLCVSHHKQRVRCRHLSEILLLIPITCLQGVHNVWLVISLVYPDNMADASVDTEPVDAQDKEDTTVDLYELERVSYFCLFACCVCAHTRMCAHILNRSFVESFHAHRRRAGADSVRSRNV